MDINPQNLMVIPFQTGKDSYSMLIVLQDANIERIKEYDPAEVPMQKACAVFAGKKLDHILVGYGTDDEIKACLKDFEDGKNFTQATRRFVRGFLNKPEDEDGTEECIVYQPKKEADPFAGLFDFTKDMGNLDKRILHRYEDDKTKLIVSTVRISDGIKPMETGVKHPRYNNGKPMIVEAYNTVEEAKTGHYKWVAAMRGKLPEKIEDCCNAKLASMLKAMGDKMEYPLQPEENHE